MKQNSGNEIWNALMTQSLAGNDGAYRRLLNEVADFLRVSVSARLRRYNYGNADIEDIVQEALIAIHTKRNTWHKDSPVRPWIHAIAIHKTIDFMRRRSRISKADLEALPESLIQSDMPDYSRQDLPEGFLETLPKRDQALVRLITLEERDIGSVARKLGMSAGAARTALHRALKKLSNKFNNIAQNENCSPY